MSNKAARTILILEDVQTILEAEGFRNIEVIGTCADAEIWVMNRTPSVALIDVRLKDGSSAGVAAMLRDRNVPLIFCSGTTKVDAEAAFSSATWVSKPCTPAELTSAVYSVGLITGLTSSPFIHTRASMTAGQSHGEALKSWVETAPR